MQRLTTLYPRRTSGFAFRTRRENWPLRTSLSLFCPVLMIGSKGNRSKTRCLRQYASCGPPTIQVGRICTLKV